VICRAHLTIHSSLYSVILQVTQLLGAFQSQTGDSYNPNHSGVHLSLCTQSQTGTFRSARLPSLVKCKLNRLNKRAAASLVHPLKVGNAEDFCLAETCSTCLAASALHFSFSAVNGCEPQCSGSV